MELPDLLDLAFTGLAVVISAVAVIISAVSLSRSRKTSEKQIELEQQQAKLAQKQLEQIEAAEKARIDVEIVQTRPNRRLRLTNVGQSDAINIEIEWLGQPLPLLRDEDSKLPVKRLKPGKMVDFVTAIMLGSAGKFEGVARWTSPNGERESDEFILHV